MRTASSCRKIIAVHRIISRSLLQTLYENSLFNVNEKKKNKLCRKKGHLTPVSLKMLMPVEMLIYCVREAEPLTKTYLKKCKPLFFQKLKHFISALHKKRIYKQIY